MKEASFNLSYILDCDNLVMVVCGYCSFEVGRVFKRCYHAVA